MFAKDILIIDFETTGLNIQEAQPLQLGAVLLDKDSLKEKDRFVSYISADLTDADPKSFAVSGITQEMLNGAPDRLTVVRKFYEQFGTNVFLSSWVEHFDRRMLQKMLREAGINPMEYDYHYLDLWPPAYLYLVKKGKGNLVRSEEIFNAFELPPRDKHDALGDCLLAADVLRKIMAGQ